MGGCGGSRRAAERIRAHFTAWAFAVDAELSPITPAGIVFADALGAIGVAGRAWVLRLGAQGVWPLVASLSGGVLLCNTSCPLPGGAMSREARVTVTGCGE